MASYHSIEKYAESLIQKSVHEILTKVENGVGVEDVGSEVAEIMGYQKRIEGILKQILNGYIYHYGSEIRKMGI